jgi:hypothetical protein
MDVSVTLGGAVWGEWDLRISAVLVVCKDDVNFFPPHDCCATELEDVASGLALWLLFLFDGLTLYLGIGEMCNGKDSARFSPASLPYLEG